MAIKPTIRKSPPSRRRNSACISSASSALPSVSCHSIRSTFTLALLLTCCLSFWPQNSNGYNIDLPSYIRHTREPNSMFGFSIALHKGRDGYPQSNSLVVGAPKYDASAYQQGVVEAGAVFRCGMNDGDCNLVRFDSKGDHRNSQGEIIERKSYQWLGATVSTSRDNDLVVACAPRYVFHTMTPSKSLRYDPVGTCFTSRNFSSFQEVSPCRTNSWGYHRQGSCQAGFSAAASKTGDRLYIGAPGSWYWQGQAYSVSPDATFPYKPPYYQPFGTGGQTYSFDVTRPEGQVFSTAESNSQDDDSYLGYSMTTGDFNGDGLEDIAIGMPRGAGLLGKIVVNEYNMESIVNITGRQIGEYFGYALASADVDGNGLDDLIIGAPMFSEHGNAEGSYDVGRVYILLQSKNQAERWSLEHIRDGYSSKGRFGLSLASLGDINRDGYGDFAVGAPYDGLKGRGIVYIFHGSANGPLDKPSQIIKSEDLVEGAPYPRTFGFSLSGGLDMDGNTYPDLAVGAYATDQVFIFKSRPVAAVNAMTSFVNPSKLIILEEKNCQTIRDAKRVACTEITSCWSYTGEYLPKSLEFDVSWVLDSSKPKNPRLFFLLDEGKNIRNSSISLVYGQTYCKNETVYLVDKVQDKLTPLKVEMRYNLRSNRRLAPVIRRRREALEPVIDQNREIVQTDTINIRKNCGLDNICEPDLRLEIKTVDKYLLGSRKPLVIDVLITNNNEDAFEAFFYLLMPKFLDFTRVQQIDKADTPRCSAPSEANNNTLKCDLGNPLEGGKVVKFSVIMMPSQKAGMSPSYDFFMEANSTNLEKKGSHSDNVIRKSIGIWVKTDLAIEGSSRPDFELYKASDYKAVENATKEEDLGPQVVHVYSIHNNGPSDIEEAVVLIHYPYQTIAGDLLMYMTNQPETDGNIRCDPVTTVNSLNLKLDPALVRKTYLGSSSSSSSSSSTNITSSSSNSSSTNISSSTSENAVHIESSHGGASGGTQVVTIGRGTKVLSADETKRLEKEDEQDVPGDASFVHSQRANAAAAVAGGNSGVSGGSNSGGNWVWSSSWNSSSDANRPASVIVSMKNTSVIHDAQGQPHIVESSTEYVRNLDRPALYHTQQHSANYQQAGQKQGGNVQPSHYEQTVNTQQSGSAGTGQHVGQTKVTPAQLQQQSQPQVVHNAREHIQMARPGGASSGYQQNTATSGSSLGSSGGAYRPQQQPVHVDSFGGNLEKVAQGGRGFQAGTLDLGTLGRDNVDNELHNRDGAGANSYNYQQSQSSVPQGGASGYRTTSYTSGGTVPQGGASGYHTTNYNSGGTVPQGGATGYHSTSYNSGGTVPQGGASGYHTTSYSSGGTVPQGGASGYHTTSYNSGGTVPQGGASGYHTTSYNSGGNAPQDGAGGASGYHTTSYNSGGNAPQDGASAYLSPGYSSGGNKPYYGTEDPDYYDDNAQTGHNNQQWNHGGSVSGHRGRVRREPLETTEAPKQVDLLSPCKAAKCETIRCVATNLGFNEEVLVAIRTRMVAKTMEKLASNVPLNVSTMAVSYVTRLPYIGEPKDEIIRSHEIFYKAEPEPEPVPDVVPLWVVVLAACAGALILLLLIFLLYKCGFFKRNRPTDHSQERQPLRNGYHGDEHL